MRREDRVRGVPRGARTVIRFTLPRRDRAYALADLEEEFEARAGLEGVGRARRWYRAQVLGSLKPLLLRRLGRLLPRRRRIATTGGRSTPGGGWAMGMQSFLNSLTYAVRTLAKAPVTVLITVLSLGLGIGAVTTVFAVADGLFHPAAPGLREPKRLVTVYTSENDGEAWGVSSFADYEDVLRAAAIDDAAASKVTLASLEEGESVEPLVAEVVTTNYFSVTGLRPALGRVFLPEDGVEGAVAMVGYDLWTERFGADPGVVGRAIRLDGRPVTVVGVAPQGVMSRRVPVRPDVWLPLREDLSGQRGGATDRSGREYLVVARLTEGADLQGLRAQLGVLGARLAEAYPDAWTDDRGQPRRFSAVSERDSRVNPRIRGVLGVVAAFFFAATGLVLLIACTNVTSLFLVRAARRRREVAVRLALGAGRRQILTLLLAEGVLLGTAAGAVGLLFCELAAGAMASFSVPINVPLRLDFTPGARAYVFAFVTALATSVVFSLVPAWRVSRPDLVTALKEGRRSAKGSRGRFGSGSAFVVVQLAAALVLIVGAGLFVRSLRSAATLDLGLDPSGVAIMSRTVPDEIGPDGIVAFYRDLESRLADVPGASASALSRSVEMTVLQIGAPVSVDNASADQPPGGIAAYRNSVTPGYLEMLGVPLVRGRTIGEGDVPGAPRVAVVNEAFARTAWPGEDPLGRTFTLVDRDPRPHEGERGPVSFQVVGVTADGTYMDVGDPPTPYLWTSLYQDPSRTIAISLKGTDAEAMVRELRSRVAVAAGEVPILLPTTYRSQLSLQVIHLRLASRVLGWGGAFGLFLALIGVYGLVSFTVAERTREIAIRRAVGADTGRVLGGVVRQGMTLASIGLAVGLAVLLPSAHLVRGVLVGVQPADPVSLSGGVVILLGTALLATLVPAARAARIDPMASLRQE